MFFIKNKGLEKAGKRLGGKVGPCRAREGDSNWIGKFRLGKFRLVLLTI